jgi:CheY-like chemotaxis protein
MTELMRHYIMVIEDARDERDAAQLILEIAGYQVTAVANGEQALSYMRAADPPPCMILLDLMMHGTNGWEFRTEQLRDARLASIPVVVCSGDGRLTEKALALGIVGQLMKPIDPTALLRLVGEHCHLTARLDATMPTTIDGNEGAGSFTHRIG